MIIAHKDNDQLQALDDHLFNVADYCQKVGDKIKLGNFMKLIGLTHDLGKSDPLWQDYIYGRKKGKFNHSSAGGKYIQETLAKMKTSMENQGMSEVMSEVMAYVIYSHHGLFDIIHEVNGNYVMKTRFDYETTGNYAYQEKVIPYINKIEERLLQETDSTIQDIYFLALEEFKPIFNKIQTMAKRTNNNKNAITYYTHCLVRLALSILKEGDIYDSANAFETHPVTRVSSEKRQQFWEESVEKVENLAEKFADNQSTSPLNTNRTKLSNQLKESGLENESGIFKLEMPTGSGKTHASLRYSINNAKKYHKDRIFYVTAFLSVLEQNATTIKETLTDSDYILEHHSNIIQEDEKDNKKLQYLTDSWNSPFVLTTMVQFFQSMFKGKASNIRRFHQFIDSIIIIDEVQSLPIKTIYHFNLMMNFMSEIMHTNIVLCTATQPILDLKDLDYPITYTKTKKGNSDLAILDSQMQSDFRRTKAVNLIEDNSPLTTEDLANNIQADLETHHSILVILNTKKAVKELFNYLKETTSATVIYLTTNLCAIHRLDKIKCIKEELDVLHKKKKPKETEKIIVVSTQLVEAGVDFDFNIVYRSLAGIDSLVQAAGRCNRNGLLEYGLVKVFLCEEEKLDSLKEITEAKNASLLAMKKVGITQKNQEFSLESLQEDYYEKYFINQTNAMGYKLKNERIIDLLGFNKDNRTKNMKNILAQSFAKAAKHFNLIDDETVAVIVPYESKDNRIFFFEEKQKLYQAIEDYNFEEVRKITKKFQAHTIQVRDIYALQHCVEPLLDGKIYFLLEEYYDREFGLNKDDIQALML